MAQSLSRIHLHLVFSTKNREPLILDEVRSPLHAYLATVLRELDCPATLINSAADHVHVLFSLARTVAVADVVEDVKKSSSKWMKTQGPRFAGFAWQAGYGVFSVSESSVAAVTEYIAKQDEHHRKLSFQDELRLILTRHRVSFDERYLWD